MLLQVTKNFNIPSNSSINNINNQLAATITVYW